MKSALFKAARAAMANSHSPYSKFPVGAAVMTSAGNIYGGCNIENAAYPEGWCAETSAISHMVVDGGTAIREILVISPGEMVATPCGGCRQRIAEFGNRETVIHLATPDGVERVARAARPPGAQPTRISPLPIASKTAASMGWYDSPSK